MEMIKLGSYKCLLVVNEGIRRHRTMRKKLIRLVGILTCVIFITTACESRFVKEARSAFGSEDYAKVVELLSEEKIEDPELEQMLRIANIYVAYENARYSDVVSEAQNLGEEKKNSEIVQMLAISKAYVAYENAQYMDVINELQKITNAKESGTEYILSMSKAYVAYDNEQYFDVVKQLQNIKDEDAMARSLYEDSFKKYIDEAVNENNVEAVAEVYDIEKDSGEYIYTKLTFPCDDLDYQAFEYLERVNSLL